MNTNDTITRINYKSDFDFTLELHGADGAAIGFPACDFAGRLYTFCSANQYRFSSIGGEAVNCYDDGGRLHVVVDSHTMGCGRMRLELTLYVPDALYPDGTRRTVTRLTLPLELVSGAASVPVGPVGDFAVTLPVVTLPVVSDPVKVKWPEIPLQLIAYRQRGSMPLKARPGFLYRATLGIKRLVPKPDDREQFKEYGEIDFTRLLGEHALRDGVTLSWGIWLHPVKCREASAGSNGLTFGITDDNRRVYYRCESAEAYNTLYRHGTCYFPQFEGYSLIGVRNDGSLRRAFGELNPNTLQYTPLLPVRKYDAPGLNIALVNCNHWKPTITGLDLDTGCYLEAQFLSIHKTLRPSKPRRKAPDFDIESAPKRYRIKWAHCYNPIDKDVPGRMIIRMRVNKRYKSDWSYYVVFFHEDPDLPAEVLHPDVVRPYTGKYIGT